MKPSKNSYGLKLGAFGLFLANSQTFWSLFAAVAFSVAGISVYTMFFDGASTQSGSDLLASVDAPEPLTGDTGGIYSESLITMIDRMDADIDDEVAREVDEEVTEDVTGEEAEFTDGFDEELEVSGGDSETLGAENVFAAVEAFAFQAFDGQAGTDTLLAVAVKAESLGSVSEEEAEQGRSDPFAPLLFDDGTGNVHIVGGSSDPIETDPTKDVQFMGVIGDAEGGAGDAVAILRLTDGSALGTMVMRAGDSFDIKGEKAFLEKVEDKRVLVKLAGESHYIDLATFVDTVVTVPGGGGDSGLPSAEGEAGPSERPEGGNFEELEEL